MSASDTRNPYKPLATLALIVLALFALDRVAGVVLSQVVKLSDYRISRIYAGTAKADVLVLGNSVGNAMVIPPYLQANLGRSVFSIALHGIDARTQEVMVEDMIDSGQAPKLAIIEIRTVTGGNVNAPEYSAYAADSPRLTRLIKEIDDTTVPWGDIFHVTRYNSRFFPNLLQKIVIRNDQRTGPSDGRISEAIKKKWLSSPSLTRPVPAQVQALRNTVLALRKAGTRVVIVAAPLNKVAMQLGPWPPKLIAAVRQAMPPDVPVVDFTQAISEDRYFEDPVHMNAIGRKAFLPYLVELARKNGV